MHQHRMTLAQRLKSHLCGGGKLVRAPFRPTDRDIHGRPNRIPHTPRVIKGSGIRTRTTDDGTDATSIPDVGTPSAPPLHRLDLFSRGKPKADLVPLLPWGLDQSWLGALYNWQSNAQLWPHPFLCPTLRLHDVSEAHESRILIARRFARAIGTHRCDARHCNRFYHRAITEEVLNQAPSPS